MINKLTFITSFVILSLSIVIVSKITAASEPNSDKELEAAIVELGSGPNRLRAQAMLIKYPAEKVVPVLVDNLLNNPDYQKPDHQDGATRHFAYHVLFSVGAARIPEGFEQIIRGLNDPAGQLDCARALIVAPSERHTEAVKALGEHLRSEQSKPEFKSAIIGTLLKLGPESEIIPRTIEKIFANNDYPENLRWHAAKAMLVMTGLEDSMKKFRDVDAVGERVSIGALGGYPFREKTQEVFDAFPEIKVEIRKMVLKGLESQDVKTRKVALEALGGIWGEEFATRSPEGGWSINKEVGAALEVMVSKDPDETLRQRAAEGLEFYRDSSGD